MNHMRKYGYVFIGA